MVKISFALSFLIALSGFGQSFTFRDTPWLGALQISSGQPYDDIESYSNGANLNALNGGSAWGGAYVDRSSVLGVYDSDDLESYSDGAAVSGLNGPQGFSAAYADRFNYLGTMEHDTFESYSDGASVNGLNGGTSDAGSWGGAFVDR